MDRRNFMGRLAGVIGAGTAITVGNSLFPKGALAVTPEKLVLVDDTALITKFGSPEAATPRKKEILVTSREHFYQLLESGHVEFRIVTILPSQMFPGSKKILSEDAPFDKDDPMSYVLVDLIFDKIHLFAKM